MIGEFLFRIYASLIAVRSNQQGASAVEYGLIIGLIAILLITAMTFMSGELDTLFTTTGDELAEVSGGGGGGGGGE